MHYLMTPLEKHYDCGFGAMANSFMEAADDLQETAKGGVTFLNRHLPISFLYRHAVELFLKSGILILHKRFEIPYGSHGVDGEPQVPLSGKWRPMYTVHDTAPLYAYTTSSNCVISLVLALTSRTSWH